MIYHNYLPSTMLDFCLVYKIKTEPLADMVFVYKSFHSTLRELKTPLTAMKGHSNLSLQVYKINDVKLGELLLGGLGAKQV